MLSHQAMLFPAFQVQQGLQRQILGTAFWDKQTAKRQEQSAGEYISINQYVMGVSCSFVCSFFFCFCGLVCLRFVFVTICVVYKLLLRAVLFRLNFLETRKRTIITITTKMHSAIHNQDSSKYYLTVASAFSSSIYLIPRSPCSYIDMARVFTLKPRLCLFPIKSVAIIVATTAETTVDTVAVGTSPVPLWVPPKCVLTREYRG